MYTLQTKTICGGIQPQFFKQIYFWTLTQVASKTQKPKTTITPKKPKACEDIQWLVQLDEQNMLVRCEIHNPYINNNSYITTIEIN